MKQENKIKKYLIVSSFAFVGVCLLVAAAHMQKTLSYLGGL